MSGYYTSWAQYDGRLEKKFEDSACGRGVDITKHSNHNYDTVILGFFGIKGDKGKKKKEIDASAKELKISDWQITPVDNWGMVGAATNCGFKGWQGDNNKLFTEKKAQGMLGAFRKMHKNNPEQKLAFSVGGWTMSDAFSEVAQSEEKHKIFNKSIADFIKKFPMFTEIDLDWEFPGDPGEGANRYSPNDGKNYALLIKALVVELKNIGRLINEY